MRKLVILTVVLALVLGLAGVASAAVTQDQAAAKLKAMGVIQGDEGGLRLGDTITRAEFSKIAVVLAGMEKSADVLKNTPSQFSDIKTGEWYTGWVNLAASQGFVKGDPDGKFRPNDKITYAEVVTILLRALGYNDNLPGSWPVEYLAKAGELGVTKDVSFDATAPGVRGSVFVLSDATLDQNWVKYSKDTDSFIDGKTPAEKLVVKNYKGSVVKDALITAWSLTNGKYTITKTEGATTTSYTFASSFNLAGADNVSGLEGTLVDLILDKDGNVAVATVKDYGSVKDTEQDVTNSDYAEAILWKADGSDFASGNNSSFKVKNDDKTYSVATNAILSGTLPAKDTTLDPDGYKLDAAKIALLFDKDNNVAYIKLSSPGQPGLVKEVNTSLKRITAVSGTPTSSLADFNNDASKAEKVYKIFKSGKEIKFEDIKAGDTFSVKKDSNGLDYSVTIGGKQASGKLNSIEYAGVVAWRIKVGDTKYELATTNGTAGNARAMVSVDGGSNYSNGNMTADLEGLIDKDVTLTLNGNSDVEYVKGNTGAASGNYAIVKGINLNYKGGGTADTLAGVNLLLSDGSKATYNATADSKVKSVNGTVYKGDSADADAQLAIGQTVKYDLASDGTIGTIEVVAANDASAGTVTSVDKDNKRIEVGSSWYNITDSTVVFKNAAAGQTPKLSNWSELKNYAGTVNYIKTSGANTQYVVLRDDIATSSTVAIVTERGTDADGKYVKLNVKGTVSRYDADGLSGTNLDAYNGAAYKDVMIFTASGSDLSTLSEESVSNATYTVKSVDAATNSVQITDGTTSTWYFTDSSTVIYSVSSSPAYISIGDVQVGDKVNAPAGLGGSMVKASNILKYLVIKN